MNKVSDLIEYFLPTAQQKQSEYLKPHLHSSRLLT